MDAPQPRNSSSRKTLLTVIATILVLGLVAAIVRSRTPAPRAPIEPAEAQAPVEAPPDHDDAQPTPAPAVVAPSVTPAGVPPKPRQAAPLATEPEPSAESRALVNRLIQASSGAETPEAAQAAVDGVRQLIQQGTNSIAAIREFLARNTDLSFGTNLQQTLGFASVRPALFAALTQIGGPEAVDALSGALQTTADPREIAMLARNLDTLEPGQHQEEAVAMARQTLAMAADGKLGALDVAPLFEVLQRYGDATVAPDLQKAASRWNIYATVALAQMPDGAGIPSLISLAGLADGTDNAAKAAAVQMLGGVVGQSSDARTALLNLARQGQLSSYNWATLEPVLTGEQYHFQNAVLDPALSTTTPDSQGILHDGRNQNFYLGRSTSNLTPDDVQQRLSLIDNLLAATSDATAVQMLQRSKAQLSGTF